MNKYNTELTQITKVLNNLDIKEIGESSHFCARKRIIKPFELVMSLITALGDKSVDTVWFEGQILLFAFKAKKTISLCAPKPPRKLKRNSPQSAL